MVPSTPGVRQRLSVPRATIRPRRSMRSKPIRRMSSSSRRESGRSWSHGARDVMGLTSRRAACGSMHGRPFWPAARPARPSFPANRRRACWSTPSTMAKPTRCRPSRSCPPEEIATLTEWVQRGVPWGVAARTGLDPAGSRQDSGRALEGGIPGTGSVLELSAAAQVSPPAVSSAHAGWVRNPIDRFILAALEAKGPRPRARSRQANLDSPSLSST